MRTSLKAIMWHDVTPRGATSQTEISCQIKPRPPQASCVSSDWDLPLPSLQWQRHTVACCGCDGGGGYKSLNIHLCDLIIDFDIRQLMFRRSWWSCNLGVATESAQDHYHRLSFKTIFYHLTPVGRSLRSLCTEALIQTVRCYTRF